MTILAIYLIGFVLTLIWLLYISRKVVKQKFGAGVRYDQDDLTIDSMTSVAVSFLCAIVWPVTVPIFICSRIVSSGAKK